MFRKTAMFFAPLVLCGAMYADVIVTTDPNVAAQFQQGLTTVDFENLSGITPQTITSYTSGAAVSSSALLFTLPPNSQQPDVEMTAGGMVGVNGAVVYQLSGGIAGDAHSGTNVLGAEVSSLDGPTQLVTDFDSGAQLEMFFPHDVSKVGFWLNPSLGNVEVLAETTNFAFSHDPNEMLLDSQNPLKPGEFIGISDATADIGGLKILGLTDKGFTIDDFSYGGTGTTATPEPSLHFLAGGGLFGMIGIAALRRRRKKSNVLPGGE
jgi:hypothetical protein